jgi:predicted GIY-YIG superfamily endonuclease
MGKPLILRHSKDEPRGHSVAQAPNEGCQVSFYTYLLRCRDGSYYAGHTDNLDARLIAHQTGFLRGYTHSRRPVSLDWLDQFETRDDAFRCERQIKGWSRAKKRALIDADWDRLKALAALRGDDRMKASSLPWRLILRVPQDERMQT